MFLRLRTSFRLGAVLRLSACLRHRVVFRFEVLLGLKAIDFSKRFWDLELFERLEIWGVSKTCDIDTDRRTDILQVHNYTVHILVYIPVKYCDSAPYHFGDSRDKSLWRTEVHTDGQTYERTDGWTDGWTDGQWQIDTPFLSKLEHYHEYIISKRNNKWTKERTINIISFLRWYHICPEIR